MLIKSKAFQKEKKIQDLLLMCNQNRGRINATINLWVEEKFGHNQNTSQLWRFFKQSNGTYLIQNARSGLYIQETVNGLKLGDKERK